VKFVSAIAVPVAPTIAAEEAPAILIVAAEPAAFVLVPHPILVTTALRVLVAEPGSDLVAGAFEESAIVVAAIAVTIASFEAFSTPSRALITRIVPRVVTIISHIQPPWVKPAECRPKYRGEKRMIEDGRSS
jgi:hypothetical protein